MIRIGIVGTGLIARTHAEAIREVPNTCQLVAATDISPERLKRFSDAYPGVRCYANSCALIADPKIDLVAITTPPSAHEAAAVNALDAGKYVFCEKPLAHSLASAHRIAKAEARHPGKLSVSYQLRYDPAFRRLAWLAREGWLGDLRSAILDRHGSIPHNEHGKNGWWGAWGVAGGGVLVTQLIHEIDLLIQIMGKPVAIKAIADRRYTAIESEDFIEATLTFAHERTARLTASVNSGTLGGGLLVRGDAGEATLNGRIDLMDEVRAFRAAKAADAAVPVPPPPFLDHRLVPVAEKLGFRQRAPMPAHARMYLDIAAAIASGRPLPVPSADAMISLEVCMAAYESAITGREIALPLAPVSMVYDGVNPDDFAARKCQRDLPGVFVPQQPGVAKRSPTTVAISLAKKAVVGLGIDPQVVKAILRRPPIVHGGPKTRVRTWPRRRAFGYAEKRAVAKLFDREICEGDRIRYDGEEEQQYCANFARSLGGGYADAVNAGTTAVYVALKALDLQPGSEVVVPPVTDAGGTMPVAVMNCIPVVADVAPGSVLVSVDQVRAVLSERTSAIMVSHIAGHPVDLDPILELAAERGIPVVEDCAQSHGTVYKGRMVGTFGAISAFSTMFLKNHATGGQGGVVFTRDPRLFARARQVADRGKPFGMLRPEGSTIASLNFNQDEISMAIGRVQLKNLPAKVAARRAFAAAVAKGLDGLDEVAVIGDPPWGESSYHFLMLRLDVHDLCCTVEEFAAGLMADGIGGVAPYKVFPTDNPWYRNAAVFGKSGMPWSMRLEAPTPKTYELANARELTCKMFRVDLYESLGPAEARDLVKAIRKAVSWYRSRAAS